jgi:hypothetical protein
MGDTRKDAALIEANPPVNQAVRIKALAAGIWRSRFARDPGARQSQARRPAQGWQSTRMG